MINVIFRMMFPPVTKLLEETEQGCSRRPRKNVATMILTIVASVPGSQPSTTRRTFLEKELLVETLSSKTYYSKYLSWLVWKYFISILVVNGYCRLKEHHPTMWPSFQDLVWILSGGKHVCILTVALVVSVTNNSFLPIPNFVVIIRRAVSWWIWTFFTIPIRVVKCKVRLTDRVNI